MLETAPLSDVHIDDVTGWRKGHPLCLLPPRSTANTQACFQNVHDATTQLIQGQPWWPSAHPGVPRFDHGKVMVTYPSIYRTHRISTRPRNLKEPNQGVLDMYSTQINAFEGMILRLRRKFNAKLAIFRIPSEILSEIFLYCIDGEFTSNSLYTPRTFNFIHVCWYWKVVAYDTPHLWSTWPGGCIDAWPILYARSKSAPLNIHLRKCPTDPTILVPILSDPDTSKRLRSFDFRGHASLFEQFLEYLLAHHQGTFPNLQDLRIDISCTGALTGCEAFRHITRFISSSFPKLNILELINLGINWNTAFPSLSSIVELTIRNPLNVNRPKMDQLVSLLGCNPRMKKLILDDDGALPQPDDTGNKGGFLGLPDLRVLHLNGNLLPTMDLLEHLLLPPELQHISVSVEATGSTEAILPHLKPFLTSYYLSEDREERKIDGLRLAIDELQTSILTIATTPNALSTSEATVSQIPLPPMSLHIQTYQDKRPLSMDVFQFLPLGNLRDLSLESLEFTVQQCRLLFGQVRRLEELCVSGSSGPGGIAALELPIPPSQDKDKEKEAGAPVSSTKRQKGKMKSGKGNLQVKMGIIIHGLT